jgi:hypothetical protein
MKLYLDEAAMHRVVRATGIPLRRNVDFAAFSSQLNGIVRSTMLRMLSLPFSRKEFDKLKRAFETYEELSKKLQTADYFPPKTPRSWHSSAQNWFSEMDSLYEKRSKGGRKRNFIATYLYPRTIGLFHAGFGVKGTSNNDLFGVKLGV